jgi:hypothetical protein
LFYSIQFIYLRANLTAQRPTIKRARVEKKTHKNKSKAIIIIIPLTQIKAKEIRIIVHIFSYLYASKVKIFVPMLNYLITTP